ncbi:acyl-CoA thioesterase [Thiomicrorhabdus sp.]|uniref:acyl-CoA thioesterase n=1 Tax=Thiomicrorhabdus sp. TaxID=2039724 RepID=UPI002AA93F74|nr:acyl-CoA thioesterase [Thiomicrorhabdus sp.]
MNQTNKDVFKLTMEARDHECDIQGVVNNAHYQHYFEHARHRYLLDHKIDFAQLAKQGINLMVNHIEISYKASLRAHDTFIVTVEPIQISKLKVCFKQIIYMTDSTKIMAIANTTVVTVGDNAKPLKNSPLLTLFN